MLTAVSRRRIVMNIAGNSLKYTERGFVHIKLEAKSLQERKQNRSKVVLTVTDTGKGMSQEYLNSELFTPFVQEVAVLSSFTLTRLLTYIRTPSISEQV